MQYSGMSSKLVILSLLLMTLPLIMTDKPTVCHEARGVKFTIFHIGSAKLCLYFVRKRMPYLQAKWLCTAMHSRLAVVNAKDKLKIVQQNALGKQMWVGMEAKHGSWYWANGEKLNEETRKEVFAPGEPSDFSNNEDCVHYWFQKTSLNNGKCGSEFQSVCEYY